MIHRHMDTENDILTAIKMSFVGAHLYTSDCLQLTFESCFQQKSQMKGENCFLNSTVFLNQFSDIQFLR